MADPIIKLKRSAVYGKIPTADQLPLGEVALNTYDGYLYASKNVGIGTTVVAINPFRVGTGTNTYNAYFTAGNVGIGTTIPKAKLEVNVGTAVTALDIQGSAGQLFSVTNNLTSGSIFSVNDVSGIPSIDVDADGTIQLAPYGSTEYVGIGTTNPTAKLDVNGGLNVTGVATATSFSGSGASLTSIPAGQLTGTVADARLSTVSSSKLSGALPALDGSALTGLTGASAATYGSANATPVIVVDSNGRITGISTVATAGSGSGSGNVVDDTSPQLGGDLDLNSNNITGTGNIDITGTLNVTGVSTFQGNVNLGDDDKIILGDNGELEIFYSGTNSIIDQVGSGDLILRTTSPGDDIILRATDDVFIQVAGTENSITCNSNGSVELYYDNAKKLETGQYGVIVTGSLAASNIDLEDDAKLLLCTGDDLQIYHDGSNSYIKDVGTGILQINTNYFQVKNADDDEFIIQASQNGAVSLRFDNSEKFATTGGGISVTGVCTATSFSGDGANLTNVPTGFSPINFVLS